ncbi:MAG: amidohydrolase family protein [Candidatus Geothermarchaeales archaeon]
MIVDVHVHPFRSVTEDQLIGQMDRADVDYAVLLAIDVDASDVGRPEVLSKILKRLRSSPEYRFDSWGLLSSLGVNEVSGFRRLAENSFPQVRVTNREVKEWVDRLPNRFVGFGSVNLCKDARYVKEGLEEILRIGLLGVKVLPTVQFFNPSKSRNFSTVRDFCERNKMILMCHTGCDPGPFEIPELSADANPKFLDGPLDRYDVKTVLAHMGSYSAFHPGIWLKEALKLGEKHENVWADVAAVPFLLSERNSVEKIRASFGFDRVLFGSDYPAVAGRDMGSSISTIQSSPFLSTKEKEKVLGENARRLLNL